MTVCSLVRVGTSLHVRGLDAIHAIPVLDIEPYMPEFGPMRSGDSAGVVL